MPKEARDKAGAELNKLKMMSPMSAEATVVRNYIDWLVKVPWKKRTKILKDIGKPRPCWTKTTLAWTRSRSASSSTWPCSIASRSCADRSCAWSDPRASARHRWARALRAPRTASFVRMSLGGVRDEAEIRGHRRTYIGSMPGKIVQNMAKAGVHNPLFLLDEVDKMSMDFRGDPSSALLEVLDPEQNATFNDHYLEVDLDLSEVMFVCTANTLNIPSPLLDRMEVIRLPGYTEDEKMNIGRRYLVPKQMKANGLRGQRAEGVRPGAA